ncbi:MAG: RpiB/LacA/LacB family sugar-phosphate isomerase [Candidatus Kerfeldbacteria bacterium]|nr:RpiB/LacA/LacB family sugar-phosphate isomerase [Candidatus Kerfeldbacteria bacterium]
MIYLGADHGGFALKEQLKTWLHDWQMTYTDLGAKMLDPEDDYPDYAFAVAQAVGSGQDVGILACRSAAGVVIAANKVRGVRAVAPLTEEAAQHSREHNDANVLGLSGDWLDDAAAKAIVQRWLTTPFSKAERHQRRLDKITAFEQQS